MTGLEGGGGDHRGRYSNPAYGPDVNLLHNKPNAPILLDHALGVVALAVKSKP